MNELGKDRGDQGAEVEADVAENLKLDACSSSNVDVAGLNQGHNEEGGGRRKPPYSHL